MLGWKCYVYGKCLFYICCYELFFYRGGVGIVNERESIVDEGEDCFGLDEDRKRVCCFGGRMCCFGNVLICDKNMLVWKMGVLFWNKEVLFWEKGVLFW